jgi:hypothetical protein
MTKRKTTPKTKPQKITKSKTNIARAIKDLGLNVPYYDVRLVGNRLEFHCYGGLTLYWPDPKDDAVGATPRGCPKEGD